METAFRAFVIILIVALAISAVLHVALFASDSNEYKNWVGIQMALQVLGVSLLVFVLSYKPIPLIVFAVVSIPFIIINSSFVNYGSIATQLILYSLFWLIFGILIYGVRGKFFASN
jgi:hypothetical protein